MCFSLFQGRRHCDCLQGAAKAEHSTALMRHLLAWATDNKALDQVGPFPGGGGKP